jgi:dextranase
LQNLSFVLTPAKPVTKLWAASPDIDGGALRELSFSRNGNAISFVLPSLVYWDMIVAEY